MNSCAHSEPFDLEAVELVPGITVLEASAGTGKTFAIAGLFLRCVVQLGLTVEQILVVTFTRAATAELRQRIRDKLALARRICTGFADEHPDANQIRRLLQASRYTLSEQAALLNAALESFDQAAICTIDSFCQRVLQEHAFATGTLFENEFITDSRYAITAVVDDFWRELFYHADGSVRAQLAESASLRHDHLVSLAQHFLRHPELYLLPKYPDPGAERLRLEATNNTETETANQWAVLVKLELLSTLRQRLTQTLERDRLLTFADLRQRLDAALQSPAAETLVAALRRRIRVALIDEFQDTDPVQFRIFERLFAQGARDQQLYLVGDPKQAIYSFRGADVFAYLAARGLAQRRFTLPANWRSERRLVEAVNTIFSQGRDPFIVSDIPFQPVVAKGGADHTPLLDAGARRPPLCLWYWEPGPEFSRKPQQQRRVASAVATEVVRLLGEGSLGPAENPRLLRPRDCAVLVASHAEADLIEEALRRVGIPTVRQTQQKVLATEEAREWLRVLQAWVEPGNERALRAAATTSMLGWTAGQLSAAEEQPSAWLAFTKRFREHAQRWERHGVLAAWQAMLEPEGIRARLLGLPDGERRFTNFQQLAELLQCAATEQNLGQTALLNWLERRVSDPEAEGDDELLVRLDRDDDAVRLVTIHASKGLEYPVVFCPFLFEPAEKRFGKNDLLLHHSAEASNRLVATLLDDDQAEAAAKGEHFAEKLRLTYVALTRAQHRCYVAWGPLLRRGSGFFKSPLGWLLHPPPVGAGMDQALATLEAHLYPDKSPRPLWPELEALVAANPEAIELVRLTDERDCVTPRNDTTQSSPAWPVKPSGSSGPPPLLGGEGRGEGGPPSILPPSFPPAAKKRGMPEETAHPSTFTVGTPGPTSQPALQSRTFSGQLERGWTIASYSSLTGQRHEAPVVEPTEPPPPRVPETEADAFRGTQAGNCLHAVLERFPGLDPTQPEALPKLITDQLRLHGYDPAQLADTLQGLIERTLQTRLPVDPLGPSEDRFRLSDISRNRWACEVPFHLPLAQITPASLGEIARQFPRAGTWTTWPDSLAELGFDPLRGFLTGKMDLVFEHEGRFYLVDWKSNVLGPTPADYTPERVFAAMLSSQYLLQYHLYILALDQHLRRRIPGYDYQQHFGGVFYLFVRGLDEAHPGHGVFADKPPAEMIELMSRTLLDLPTGGAA